MGEECVVQSVVSPLLLLLVDLHLLHVTDLRGADSLAVLVIVQKGGGSFSVLSFRTQGLHLFQSGTVKVKKIEYFRLELGLLSICGQHKQDRSYCSNYIFHDILEIFVFQTFEVHISLETLEIVVVCIAERNVDFRAVGKRTCGVHEHKAFVLTLLSKISIA